MGIFFMIFERFIFLTSICIFDIDEGGGLYVIMALRKEKGFV